MNFSTLTPSNVLAVRTYLLTFVNTVDCDGQVRSYLGDRFHAAFFFVIILRETPLRNGESVSKVPYRRRPLKNGVIFSRIIGALAAVIAGGIKTPRDLSSFYVNPYNRSVV